MGRASARHPRSEKQEDTRQSAIAASFERVSSSDEARRKWSPDWCNSQGLHAISGSRGVVSSHHTAPDPGRATPKPPFLVMVCATEGVGHPVKDLRLVAHCSALRAHYPWSRSVR